MNTNKILSKLEKEFLPKIAKYIISHNNKLPYVFKYRFYQNPDSVEEHKPKWHQWGIITHSLKFREAFDTQVFKYLEQWGMKDQIEEYLAQEIDGVPKKELIRIAAPLHDLGKFQKGLKIKENGKIKFDFSNHEELSEKLILTHPVRRILKEFQLTDNQIEYIAKCAGNHYKLGFIRKKAKKSDVGYTMKFIESPEFYKMVKTELPKFEDLKVEIGLLFLSDSLGKCELNISANSDEEIEYLIPKLEQEIKRRNLNPYLIEAVKQSPVNLAASREYLKIALNGN